MSPGASIKTIAFFALAVLIALAAFLLLARLALGVAKIALYALPILFTIAALVSCFLSAKPEKTKILWIIIILLAPFFGPLLWFVWGKNHT